MSRPLGLILMTALPPTVGHVALIHFAQRFMQGVGGRVLVLICSHPSEPGDREFHFQCLRQAAGHGMWSDDLVMRYRSSADPQEPTGPDDQEFWDYWAKTCYSYLPRGSSGFDYVFSSESYGERLAHELSARHIQYDPGRETSVARATNVRNDPVADWSSIVEPLRAELRRRVVLFGQESVGKTTMARSLARRFNSSWVPEWARGYLESFPDPEVTPQRMEMIIRGQSSSEAAAVRGATGPFIFQDTDTLSTLGYWLHMQREDRTRNRGASDSHYFRPGSHNDTEFRTLFGRFHHPADLYVVMSDDCPFVPDPLRYGGDRRETDVKFWTDLLDERRLNYVVMDQGWQVPDCEDVIAGHCQELLETRAGFVGYVR